MTGINDFCPPFFWCKQPELITYIIQLSLVSYSRHGSNITIYGEGNTLTLRDIFGASGANVTLNNVTLVDSNPDD